MKMHFYLAVLFVSTLLPFVAFADEATTTPDTTAPIITAPVEQTFAATAIPASPLLTAAIATDDTDPAPVVTYAPQSFPLGTTTVVWTATDSSGNSATTSSQVGVYLHVEASVDVAASCDVTDSDSVVHNYPAASSTSYLGICALSAAVASSSISSVVLSNQFPSIGLFVTALGGAVADPSSQYWALYQNGSFASLGLSQLPVVAGNTITLQLHDFSDNNLGSEVTFRIASLIATSTATTTADTVPPDAPTKGGGGGGETVHFNLNVPLALAYLVSQQKADGSFASSLYSDWAALAFAASDPGAPKTLLRDYLIAATPALSSVTANVTDSERHAMALMALGINPYTGTSKDYITPIVNAFDGTQIGDANLDNDDIFAIFTLLSAGYSPSDPMLQTVVTHILSAQRADGSWDGSPDMTAAAVQAIGPFFSIPGYGSAMGRAMGYLASTQQASGGWGGIDSASWVQTMMNAAKELDPAHAPTFTSSGGRYPMDEIADAQQPDGAVRPSSDTADNRVWSTSYAVVAASGKSWLTLLQPFTRPSGSGVAATGGSVLGAATSTALTSTQMVASTTPPVATSTPETISTSTPVVIETIQGSTTATTMPKKVQPKIAKVPKKVPPPVATTTSSTPPATANQTSAAATASPSKGGLPGQGFLSNLWRSIASFFARLF